MKFFLGILFCIGIKSYSQIIDIEHPTSFSIPDIKQKCYDELLKDLKCKSKIGTNTSCLTLGDRDTILIFYSHESFYQNTYLFSYQKKGDSAYATEYYDKGFTKSLGNPPVSKRAVGYEWNPGLVLKYSATIPDPISISDLLKALDDTILRTWDTSVYISHDPDLYFSFFFEKKNINRVIHSSRRYSSPIIRRFLDHLLKLPILE